MNTANDGASRHDRLTAISTAVPEVRLVSIEHPCIVNNFENGFKSLGGEQQLKHILEDDDEQEGQPRKTSKRGQTKPVVGVSLRPHDPLAKKLESTPVTSRNVLVKVTLPRWTGRKRKRGTDEPFTGDPQNSVNHDISAPDLIQRLQDNVDKYRIEAVGKVATTHRFNNLPDLQVHSREAPVMREISRHAMVPDYDTLKKFHIDLTPGSDAVTALPRPPFFIPPDQQEDDPFPPGANTQPTARKTVQADEPKATPPPRSVAKPRAKPAPGAEVPASIKPTVETIQNFLDHRPIVTKNVLVNCFPNIPVHKITQAMPWAGQRPRTGPWGNCLIKHGLEPTSDPKYRFYQVVASRPHHNRSKAKEDETEQDQTEEDATATHVFDGKTKTKAAVYQFCDIIDPTLTPVINTPHFRTLEEGYGGPKTGWYHAGTIAKMKMMVGDKVKRMHDSKPLLEDRAYAAVAALPEKMDEDTICNVDAVQFGAEARTLGLQVRKEAVRLIGRRTGRGTGEEDSEDEGNGQQDNAVAPGLLIDPFLLGSVDQHWIDGGNGVGGQPGTVNDTE